LAITIKGGKDSANATLSLLSVTDLQKQMEYFRTKEILGQPVGKLAKNHMVRDRGKKDKDKRAAEGDTKVYAYAGTMVYAHANSYGAVGYRYGEGPATWLSAQRPNTDMLPSYDIQIDEALAKKRLQVVLALGRAFRSRLITPTEAMTVKVYERCLRHLVVSIWNKGS